MRQRVKHVLTRVRGALRKPLAEVLSKGSDAYELAGVGCLVGAAWWWDSFVGLASLGVALIWLGWVTHESE